MAKEKISKKSQETLDMITTKLNLGEDVDMALSYLDWGAFKEAIKNAKGLLKAIKDGRVYEDCKQAWARNLNKPDEKYWERMMKLFKPKK